MSFGNQAGTVPINYGGSAIPTTTDNVSVPPGGTVTYKTRVVLAFKSTVSANDEITGVCIAQSVSIMNHD
jgi:hypothetical protein